VSHVTNARAGGKPAKPHVSPLAGRTISLVDGVCFAFCPKRTSFVKLTVVKCQVSRELSHEQKHFVEYELENGGLSKVAFAESTVVIFESL
jgi:hypothetical protein